MVRLRFATYYQNHPETYDISKTLEKNNYQIKTAVEVKEILPTVQVLENDRQTDELAYLKQNVEMKIELALMYLKRSTTHLQYL